MRFFAAPRLGRGAALERRAAFARGVAFTRGAVLAFAFALSFGGAAFAQEVPLFGGEPVSGDYAVYRDVSWSEPTWIGFLYYDESTWGAFLKTPARSSDVRILFRTERVEGKLILTGQQIVSAITQNDVDAVNYLMGLLPDLYAWSVSARESHALDRGSSGVSGPLSARSGSGSGTVNIDRACAAAKNGIGSRPDRSPLLPALWKTERDGESFGGAVALDWAAEIPVFALAALRTATGSDILSLERIGRVGAQGDASFFSFLPVEYLPSKGKAAAADDALRVAGSVAGFGETRVVDGVSLSLDGNWTMVADNTFFMGDRAMVIVDRIDAASLGLDPLEANLPLALLRLFALSGDTARTFPAETKISGTPDRFEIVNAFYDGQTAAFNRDIKLCIPERDGSGSLLGVVIANLSVKDESYLANRDYFDSLF